jgi:hypothetical protein
MQTAFVKEEDLKCTLEDRMGTPHLSELQSDDELDPLWYAGTTGVVEADSTSQTSGYDVGSVVSV